MYITLNIVQPEGDEVASEDSSDSGAAFDFDIGGLFGDILANRNSLAQQ